MVNDPYYTLIRAVRTGCSARLTGENSQGDDGALATLAYLADTYQALLDQLPDAPTWVCHKGCDACCRNPVGVTGLEAIAIAEALRRNLDSGDIEDIRNGLESIERARRGLTWTERFQRQDACLFLLPDHTCGIYPWRPLGCRSLFSVDALACLAAFSGGQPDAQPFARAPVAAVGAMVTGLSLALKDLGLGVGRYELHSAVLAALRRPSPIDAWRNGHQLFEDCVPDGSMDPVAHAWLVEQLDEMTQDG